MIVHTLLYQVIFLIHHAFSNRECIFESSCMNATIVETNGATLCYGGNSCAFSTIENIDSIEVNLSIYEYIDCWGAASCKSAVLLTDSVLLSLDAAGYASNVFSKGMIFGNSNPCINEIESNIIHCAGEASCYKVNNFTITDHGMNCHSGRACDSIVGLYNIGDQLNAYGAFSLINSTLYTSGNGNNVNFHIYGYYAAWNASIHCMGNDTCYIYCGSNGCANLNVYCNTGSNNCHIDCNYSCPNINTIATKTIGDVYSEIAFVDMHGYDGVILSQLNTSYTTKNNDYACTRNSRHYFGDSNEFEYASLVLTRNGTNKDIDENVNICCAGAYSCQFSDINTHGNHSTNWNLYCDGKYSCLNVTINHDNSYNYSVYSRAAYGAQFATLSHFYKYVVTGMGGAQNGVVADGQYLYCMASWACSEMIITNVQYIYGLGFECLDNVIVHNNNSNLSIYALGYLSAADVTINCYQPYTCKMYCLNNETCDNITIICHHFNGTSITTKNDVTIVDINYGTNSDSNISITSIETTSVVTTTTAATTKQLTTQSGSESTSMHMTTHSTTHTDNSKEKSSSNGLINFIVNHILVVIISGLAMIILFLILMLFCAYRCGQAKERQKQIDRLSTYDASYILTRTVTASGQTSISIAGADEDIINDTADENGTINFESVDVVGMKKSVDKYFDTSTNTNKNTNTSTYVYGRKHKKMKIALPQTTTTVESTAVTTPATIMSSVNLDAGFHDHDINSVNLDHLNDHDDSPQLQQIEIAVVRDLADIDINEIGGDLARLVATTSYDSSVDKPENEGGPSGRHRKYSENSAISTDTSHSNISHITGLTNTPPIMIRVSPASLLSSRHSITSLPSLPFELTHSHNNNNNNNNSGARNSVTGSTNRVVVIDPVALDLAVQQMSYSNTSRGPGFGQATPSGHSHHAGFMHSHIFTPGFVNNPSNASYAPKMEQINEDQDADEKENEKEANNDENSDMKSENKQDNKENKNQQDQKHVEHDQQEGDGNGNNSDDTSSASELFIGDLDVTPGGPETDDGGSNENVNSNNNNNNDNNDNKDSSNNNNNNNKNNSNGNDDHSKFKITFTNASRASKSITQSVSKSISRSVSKSRSKSKSKNKRKRKSKSKSKENKNKIDGSQLKVPGSKDSGHGKEKRQEIHVYQKRYNYEFWEEKHVLLWIKINLLKNGFHGNVIDPFLNEFKGKNIVGTSLTQFKLHVAFLDSFIEGFSVKHQNDAIWVVIRSAILALPINETQG